MPSQETVDPVGFLIPLRRPSMWAKSYASRFFATLVAAAGLVGLGLQILHNSFPHLPFSHAWLLVPLGLLCMLAVYLINWLRAWIRYLQRLEALHRWVRDAVLSASHMQITVGDIGHVFDIRGVTPDGGDHANIILAGGRGQGLEIGSWLDVVSISSDELLGVAQVYNVQDDKAWATPIRRTDERFWDDLDRRMVGDRSGIPWAEARPSGLRFLEQALGPETQEHTGRTEDE